LDNLTVNEKRPGWENSPALAQLAFLSSRAPAQAEQGSWAGTLRSALQGCYVRYAFLIQYFLTCQVLSKNTSKVAFYPVQNEMV